MGLQVDDIDFRSTSQRREKDASVTLCAFRLEAQESGSVPHDRRGKLFEDVRMGSQVGAVLLRALAPIQLLAGSGTERVSRHLEVLVLDTRARQRIGQRCLAESRTLAPCRRPDVDHHINARLNE